MGVGGNIPAGLAVVLGRPMDGVARIVLRHERARKFRPMVILEIFLAIVGFVIFLPVLIIIALFMAQNDVGAGSEATLPTVSGRFYDYWHQLGVYVLGPNGQVLARVDHRSSSQADGDGVVAAVLAAARREGVVVVEVLADVVAGAVEVMEVWYGGRPLFSDPNARPAAQAAAFLREVGFELEETPEEVVVREPLVQPSRFWAGVALVVLGIPLAPALALFARGRRFLRDLVLNARGVPAGHQVVTLRAESIRVHQERAGERRFEELLDGDDVLGVTFSPTLGYDRDVTRRESTLRLIGARRSVTLRFRRTAEAGRALRDFLVGKVLELRLARPELGLLGCGPRLTRCPYCGGLYDLQPGTRCPFCAAPAGSVR